MVIGLLILIPLVAFISCYFTISAYTLGLKHNYQLAHNIEPKTVQEEKKIVKKSEEFQKKQEEVNEKFNKFINWN